ncbi:MAG: TrkH family potassium uptake protein [Lachnospiraceae bacterium]|nr:TrkH family potassium uptake protein [Lachnospiraceae bacterium]
MNYGIVIFILGWILRIEGALLLLPCATAVLYRENAGWCFLATAAISFILGVALTHKKPQNTKVYAREGFVVVALAWLVMSLIGAVPFTMCGDIPNYLDAVFETVSGFTTTGASILPEVESLNHCSLIWRSFTHWVGGMGIFVFMLAVVPLLGGSTFNLMRAESPGPVVGKFVPKIRDSAVILYGIYLAITIIEMLMLWMFGMPLFEAVCHTFGTVGTGGFSVKNTGYIGYSPVLQNITTFFMIACGINFQFYFYLMAKKFRMAVNMTEVRAYLGIILASILLIVINVRGMYGTLEETVRHAAFQVGTIITTTGYATYDFDRWPEFSKTILLILMMMGACAGSTGGGMKVSRFVIVLKGVRKELTNIIHPRYIKKIQFDGVPVAHETVRNTNVFVAIYFMVMILSILLVSVDNHDFTTNFTAVSATLNNIGPGLAMVGPTQNYSFYSGFSKCILIFDMLAGRLELFPVLLLLAPGSWKKYT